MMLPREALAINHMRVWRCGTIPLHLVALALGPMELQSPTLFRECSSTLYVGMVWVVSFTLYI